MLARASATGAKRDFMHQPASRNVEYAYHCCQQMWRDPPLSVLFADELSAEEAEALLPGVEGCAIRH
jgi:hypothetical protein